MTDNMRIQGPVQIEADSTPRVIFDLMDRCANHDKKVPQANRDKDYWLNLYRECSNVVYGSAAG